MNHHIHDDHRLSDHGGIGHDHVTAAKLEAFGSAIPYSIASYKEFLDSRQHGHDDSIRYVPDSPGNDSYSRVASLGLAFGIAGSVFAAACGAAFKYVADKVEEERSKFSGSQAEQEPYSSKDV